MSALLEKGKLRKIRTKGACNERRRLSLLDPELRRLATELAPIQKCAKALGIFTNERELLHCPGCCLKEDVAATGIMITYREPDLGHDIGMRFKQLNKHAFPCPGCGQRVREPLSEQRSEGASLA